MPLFFYPHFFFLNQHKHLKYWRISIHCLVVLHVWSVFFTHKVLVRNFAADYNLGSIKMKPNIFLKNEHSCVQQEIALAHCQPIPDRKKDVIQKENCTTKCCYVHLPENSADTSHHLIFTMHPLSFKAVFFLQFYSALFQRKRLFQPSLLWKEINFVLMVQQWGYGWYRFKHIIELEIIKETVVIELG